MATKKKTKGLVQLKQREIKEYRERELKRQKGICPLCGEPLLEDEAAQDHDHVTGHMRAALHISCNGAEGRIFNAAGRRSRGDSPEKFLKNLLKYWKKDYSNNPLHPKHGKKTKRRRKRKKR